MKGGVQLVTLAGIPIKVHWTFAFLLIWIAYVAYDESLSSLQTLYFFLLVAGLFICVIAHEYGHALIARKYHIPTRDIFILPIGGLARLEYLPEDPKKEIWIAIAGPLVNAGIAAFLIILIWLVDGGSYWSSIRSIQDLLMPIGWVYAMIFLNIMLFFFNLIPAYPMDGGRILRSGLSMYYGKKRATTMVSYLAQIIGILFFFFALRYNHFTVMLIGVFIFFTSRWERRAVRLQEMYADEEE